MTGAKEYRLDPLEIASGLVLDPQGPREPLPPGSPGETPVAALERAILPALRRAPCLVSFSGGRDSSAVLAVATRLARREGLPLPIPATNRFPQAESTHESEWQERVVAHLGLKDWVRLEFADELGIVGPVAARALRRHGVLWPCNAHFHVPLLQAAAGGSLLTGAGGDEVFEPSRPSRVAAVLTRRVRPEARDVLRMSVVFAPAPVRRAFLRRRIPGGWTWLRPEAERTVRRRLAATAASEPLRWRARLEWMRGCRYLQVGFSNLARLAADEDARIHNPLMSDDFLAALSRMPRADRFGDRTSAMRSLFGDLLPDEILSRTAKASFNGAFWTDECRELVARWRGDGIDSELVDSEALRTVWSSAEPSTASFTLLQSVWLSLDGEALVPEQRQQVAAGLGH